MPATPLTPAEIAALRSDMKAAATEIREAYAAESESGDATCAGEPDAKADRKQTTKTKTMTTNLPTETLDRETLDRELALSKKYLGRAVALRTLACQANFIQTENRAQLQVEDNLADITMWESRIAAL